MTRKYRVRQNPAISGFAAIGSIFFLFAGCAMMNQNASAAAPTPFQFLWVIACLAAFCTSIYNAVSDQGIATEIIQEDLSTENSGSDQIESTDTASLLHELEELRAKNLISEEEYQEKRRRVLARFDG